MKGTGEKEVGTLCTKPPEPFTSSCSTKANCGFKSAQWINSHIHPVTCALMFAQGFDTTDTLTNCASPLHNSSQRAFGRFFLYTVRILPAALVTARFHRILFNNLSNTYISFGLSGAKGGPHFEAICQIVGNP